MLLYINMNNTITHTNVLHHVRIIIFKEQALITQIKYKKKYIIHYKIRYKM